MSSVQLVPKVVTSKSSAHAERLWPGFETEWQLSRECDVPELQRRGVAMRRHLGQSSAAGEIDPGSLSKILSVTRELFGDYVRLVHGLNSLPAPSPERDLEFGRALLPFTIWQLSSQNRHGNVSQLYDLYLRTHVDPETGDPQISFPEYLSGLHNVLAVAPMTNGLPDARMYLQESETLAPRLADIERRLAAVKKDLGDAELAAQREAESAEKAGRPKADNYAIRIGKLKRECEDISAEIPTLFHELEDVLPESIPECLNSIGARVSAPAQAIEVMVKFTKDLESILVDCLTLNVVTEKGAQVLHIPQFDGDGTMVESNLRLDYDTLSQLAKDPANLIQLLSTYLAARGVLRALLPTIPAVTSVAAKIGAVQAALAAPFASQRKRGNAAIDALLASNDSALNELTLSLLADKVFVEHGWAHSLENTKHIRPLLWTVRNYLGSKGEDEKNSFYLALKDSQELSDNLLPFMKRIKSAIAQDDFEKVAKILNDEIRSASISKNAFKLLAPLFFCDTTAQRPDQQIRLKNKVTDIAKLKEFPASLEMLAPEIRTDCSSLARQAVKGLGLSMLDYYRDPNMKDLWQFIEKFKVFLRNPNCLDGLPGDKAMESGILLVGPYGAGKTFFVDCMANELEIKTISISPEASDLSGGKEGESLLGICQRKIAEAKKHAETVGPCILFIDEAEVVMPNRGDPRISLDQKELTGFMLREISQIRVKYPKILIIAATNYPDDIDGGITRPGRLDILVEMNEPGPEMRQGMILETLAKENLDLRLSSEQVEKLVLTTAEMMPLMLVRTIHELNRLTRTSVVERGEQFEFTYELLLAHYQNAAKRLKERKQMLQHQKDSVAKESVTAS